MYQDRFIYCFFQYLVNSRGPFISQSYPTSRCGAFARRWRAIDCREIDPTPAGRRESRRRCGLLHLDVTALGANATFCLPRGLKRANRVVVALVDGVGVCAITMLCKAAKILVVGMCVAYFSFTCTELRARESPTKPLVLSGLHQKMSFPRMYIRGFADSES